MAGSYSFDVVSEINMQEVDNAVNQATKEISQRYDFKGSSAKIELNDEDIKISAENEFKLSAVIEVLKGKLVKRGVSPKALDLNKIENASLGSVRQVAKLVKGISKEKAKDIINDIKESKIKVQTQIMDDKLRVSGKDKDELQKVIQLVKSKDYGIDVQFINFR